MKGTAFSEKYKFVLLVLVAAIVLPVLHVIAGFKERDDRRRIREDALKTLSNATITLVDRFNRQRWVTRKTRTVLAKTLSRHPANMADPSFLIAFAKRLERNFPASTILAFDRSGHIVFQTDRESKRGREILWAGVLQMQREGGGDLGGVKFQLPQRFCRSLFGTLTDLADLITSDGLPRFFLDRGKPRLSSIIPEETWAGSDASAAVGLGGIWLLIDPAKLPTRQITQQAVFPLRADVDAVCILNGTERHPVIEARRGIGPVPRAMVRQFLQGKTIIDADWGLWLGRYIPNENGRVVIAGIAREHLEGVIGRYRGLLGFLALVITLLLLIYGYRRYWVGDLFGMSLRLRVFLLFILTSFLPLAAVFQQGFSLAEDSFQRSLDEWERRIGSELTAIDLQYDEFQRTWAERLAEIENRLIPQFPLPKDGDRLIGEMCASFSHFEVMVLDDRGTRANVVKGIESFHTQGEYPAYISLFLARRMEIENRVPPPVLSQAFTFLSGYEQISILDKLFNSQKRFNRLRMRERNLLHHPKILMSEEGGKRKTCGLISWIFDETSFAAPFLDTCFAGIASDPETGGVLRLGFATPQGRLFPEEFDFNPELKSMVNRVAKFRANEVGTIPLLGGKSGLVLVSVPSRLGGYLLFGVMESVSRQDLANPGLTIRKIFGLSPILPVERNRILVLSTLFLSVFLSLSLMIPMSFVLSRWLVDRVTGLREIVDEIGINRLEARAEVPADDELGEVAVAINDMAAGLQERQRMSRFVSEQVLEEVKKDDRESLALGGERREVAVLFSHLHDFDRLLAECEPEMLIERLNAYFTAMDAVIKAHGGIIDKLIGDAIMAVFFERPGEAQPAVRSVEAAAAMLRVPSIPDEHPFRTDIGIHFGPAISGKVGSRQGMIDFTVIGDTVNTAARIQSIAARQPAASLLVSETVRVLLPAETRAVGLEAVSLKGKTAVVKLYKIEL